MYVRTPAGQRTARVGEQGSVDHHSAQQFVLGRSFPAPDTCAFRAGAGVRPTRHSSVYLPVTTPSLRGKDRTAICGGAPRAAESACSVLCSAGVFRERSSTGPRGVRGRWGDRALRGWGGARGYRAFRGAAPGGECAGPVGALGATGAGAAVRRRGCRVARTARGRRGMWPVRRVSRAAPRGRGATSPLRYVSGTAPCRGIFHGAWCGATRRRVVRTRRRGRGRRGRGRRGVTARRGGRVATSALRDGAPGRPPRDVSPGPAGGPRRGRERRCRTRDRRPASRRGPRCRSRSPSRSRPRPSSPCRGGCRCASR
ncbi:hypothetical protein GA0115257_11872 [Streptomyces sp. LcepLS]|nr:hypothetical protein GA0115257_11872 [Streptomyces sp. LcepLS]